MKLKELIFHPPLENNDIRTKEDLVWLIEDIFAISRNDFCFNYEKDIDENKFFFYWNQLKTRPIQHVLGYGFFLSHKFIVNENVLIPRNETEELVLCAFNLFLNHQKINVLDIGTGSGAIILSLEMLFKEKGVEFKGLGVDISDAALKVAKLNKDKFNLDTNFKLSDVYENVDGSYDLIISNPPYIDKEEFVEKRVKDNEPHIALYAENHGLEVYERILKDSKKHLNKNGIIAFEIAPEREEGLIKLIDEYCSNSKYEFYKDINGFTRFLIIYFN